MWYPLLRLSVVVLLKPLATGAHDDLGSSSRLHPVELLLSAPPSGGDPSVRGRRAKRAWPLANGESRPPGHGQDAAARKEDRSTDTAAATGPPGGVKVCQRYGRAPLSGETCEPGFPKHSGPVPPLSRRYFPNPNPARPCAVENRPGVRKTLLARFTSHGAELRQRTPWTRALHPRLRTPAGPDRP